MEIRDNILIQPIIRIAGGGEGRGSGRVLL